jgi:hypothetical protein
MSPSCYLMWEIPLGQGKEVSRVEALDDVSPFAVHLKVLKPGPWRDARAASGFFPYRRQLARTCSLETRPSRALCPLDYSPGSSSS